MDNPLTKDEERELLGLENERALAMRAQQPSGNALTEAEELEMLEMERERAITGSALTPAQSLEDLDDNDLEALSTNDLERMSDRGLEFVASQGGLPSPVDPEIELGEQTLGEQLRLVRERELTERARRQRDPRNADPGAAAIEFVKGVRAGLSGRRLENPSEMERLARPIGEYGPLVAGSLAAASTGGTTLLGSAAAQFIGVSAGEAAKKAASKALGDRPNANLADDLGDIGAVGLGAALADLGLGVAGRAAAKLPEIAIAYLKVPAESIKRALKRPYAIETGGPSAQLKVENRAVDVLSRVQNHIEGRRKVMGESVEKALEGLHRKTNGEKVFDLRPLADDLEKFINEGMGANDSTVKQLITRDYIRIKALIDNMRRDPMKSARSMVQIRRELDRMQSFRFGGVPQVNSEAGELAIRRLAKGFRDAIENTGARLNYHELTKANSRAHEFFTDYEDLRKLVGTKDRSRLEMIGKVDRLETFFNRGGLRQDLIKEIGDKYPEIAPEVDELMDLLASRSFTRHAMGSPSGNIKDLARSLMTPQNLAKSIKASQSTPAKVTAKTAGTAARVGTGSLMKVIQGEDE